VLFTVLLFVQRKSRCLFEAKASEITAKDIRGGGGGGGGGGLGGCYPCPKILARGQRICSISPKNYTLRGLFMFSKQNASLHHLGEFLITVISNVEACLVILTLSSSVWIVCHTVTASLYVLVSIFIVQHIKSFKILSIHCLP